ncbi:MAG TPA: bacillithiol biosynthesis BshC, partial [Thermoanaerobaculia bacterium]|nr:bacillithiol biosynthesis BshC [Thermoanaerobaculia bacterium]
ETFLPRASASNVGRFGRRPDASAWAAEAAAARETLAKALDASNRRWGIFAEEPLRRWAAGDTVTIIAGQQVGFAGGPLYTLAKLASVVKMKRTLEAQGTPVTAFFWLATEDHDFDEIATLNVPAKNGQLDLLKIRAVRGAESRTVVGSLPVPESLITQLLAVYDMPRPTWLREGITFRDSFAELIASTFGTEVILVDALLPELRRAGAPLFDAIRSRRDEIQRLLHDRATALEAAGYKEQVIARDGAEYTLLFALDEEGRRQPSNDAGSPERTSTSALTRPLLQDFVLQPDVFFGGPAEVAYYAQIAPLHELLNIPMPRIALRGHALVVPKRVAKAMQRFTIAPHEAFASADALLAEREPDGVARIRALAEEGKRELMQRIEQIGQLALPADHSLAGSINKSIGHLEFHFNKLSERAIKGLVRKDKERLAAVREVVATLYPDRHVQDRVVSWFSWWCTYGDQLGERLIEEVEPDSSHFRIVSL